MSRAHGGVARTRRRPLIIGLAAIAVALVGLAVGPAPAAPVLTRQVDNPCADVVDEVHISGSTSSHLAVSDWAAGMCAEADVLADAINSGSKAGRDAVIAGSTDIGLTTLPFTAEEQAALVEAERGVVMIPVLGTATVCTYWDAKEFGSYPDGRGFPDLRVSRQTAGLMLGGTVLEPIGDGGVSQYGDSLKRDNAGNDGFPTTPEFTMNTDFQVRPGYSGVTYELGRWIIQDPEAVEAFAWASLQNYEFPAEAVLPFELMPNPLADKPALTSEYSAMFTRMRGAPQGLTFGCMDAATARTDTDTAVEGIQEVNRARLENAAGEYIDPTDAAVALGIEEMIATGDGTYRPNPSEELVEAYPIPMVVYAAVPTCGFDERSQAATARVLDYMAGPGQEHLPPGNVPLVGGVAATATRQLASWKAKVVARPCGEDAPPPTTVPTTSTVPGGPTTTLPPFVDPGPTPPPVAGVQPDPGYTDPGGDAGGPGGGGGATDPVTDVPPMEETAAGPPGGPLAPAGEPEDLDPVARIVAMAQGSAALPPIALAVGGVVLLVVGPLLQTADGVTRASSLPSLVRRWFTRLRP